jgi:hypothetical protein
MDLKAKPNFNGNKFSYSEIKYTYDISIYGILSGTDINSPYLPFEFFKSLDDLSSPVELSGDGVEYEYELTSSIPSEILFFKYSDSGDTLVSGDELIIISDCIFSLETSKKTLAASRSSDEITYPVP